MDGRKIKMVLSGLLLLIATDLIAIEGGFGLGAGFRFGKPVNSGYSSFIRSYNEFYKSQLKTPFRDLAMGAGFGINTEISLGAFVMSMAYNQWSFRNLSEFTNGTKREVKLSQNQLAMGMGLGYISKKGFLTVTANMLLGTEKLHSQYIYKNGMNSYGLERALNGVYEGTRLAGSLKLQAGISVLYAGVEYLFGGKEMNPITDDNAQRSDYGYPWGLPTDVGRWFNSGSFAYGLDDFIAPVTNGWRFEIGLRFNISTGD